MRSAGNFNPEWGYLAPAPSFMRTARVVLVATAIGATAGAAVVISLIDRPAAQDDKTASIAAHAIVTSVQAATVATTQPPSTASASVAAPIKVTTAVPPSPSPAPLAQIATPPPAAVAPPTQSVAIVPPPVAAPTQPAAIVATPVVAPPQSAAVEPPQQPVLNAPAADSNVVPARKPAPGMAALSEAPPAIEAAPADTPDQALVPPETVPSEKKATKHHVASGYASNARDRPTAGLGTVLRRLFSPHTGNSYYPNR
jgi:hypothetical protein